MNMTKKLCKLFFEFPAICIYGNEGDFSRYKILKKITYMLHNENFVINKYIRDKINVMVYPQKYCDLMMVVDSDEVYIVDNIDMLALGEHDWILFPSDNLCNDEIIIFPVSDTDIEEKVSNIVKIIFVESFPFGKKEFCDFVSESVKEQNISSSKDIILFDDDFKYGATDISKEGVGKKEIFKKMGGYVNDIYESSSYKEEKILFDIKKQYIQKKRVILKQMMKLFEDSFDAEFEFHKQRWLCDEEKKSILTDAAFEEISDYKNVKNTNDVERKIFDNLLDFLEEKKQDLCNMIRRMLNVYLYDLIFVPDKDIEKYFAKVISEFKKTYKFEKKQKCPNSKLDYRVLCSNGQYVIKLRKYLEKMIDVYMKKIIKSDIEKNLKICEVKYYEENKI